MPKIEKRTDLPGSERALLPGSRKIGPSDPQEQIQVTIFLRRGSSPNQFPDAKKLGKLLPAQRQHLSRAQFASRHGARTADIKKIRTFATQNKLKVVAVSRARRSVLLGGSIAAFSRAFGVELNRYQHPAGTSRMRSGTIQIPAPLSGIIEGVFGLDNRPQAKPHFRVRKQSQNPTARAQAASVSYNAPQVAQAYDFPAGTTGNEQTIGILELSGGYNATDLATYFKNLGIATPTVTALSVDGATNSPTGDPSGADGEVELDIEVSGAVAPSAKIAVYFTPNTDQGFLDALTTAVHDTKNNPSVVSISWGGPESSWTQQALNSFNSACEDASTIGVTILVASGDDGSSDGVSSAPTVDFPASSPYVLACGGTKLTLSGTTISSEQAWNELSSNEGATGGGVSEVFALPSYQQSAGVPKAPNGFAGRGVPDVAGDADPETGYNVLVDGQQTVIGGTSAVAPLWAGLLARVNQSLGKNVGYLNPLLYTSNVESTLHDITVGINGSYSAAPGWDACTGLGTPNGAALLAALGTAAAPTKKRKKSPTRHKAGSAKRRKKS